VNQINKLIAGLNDTQKKILVVAVVAIIIGLLYVLFVGPTISHLSAVENDIAKEQSTIKEDMHFLGFKSSIERQSNEIAPYITKDKLSDNEMIASFLNKIQNLANTSKITLVKINPAPAEQDAKYWKYEADVECSGQLADVIGFMHSVNSDMDLMKVDKFSFSGKKSDTDEIKATMTIEKIVVTDKPMPLKSQDANASAMPATA
jgi:Tfp pilus assembly protein PilO